MLKRFLAVAVVLSSCMVARCLGDQSLQFHHLDMGQGDAAVLISPEGKVVLFDAGKDMANIKNCDSETAYLEQLGVTHIDYIFVSHYHTDHIGCIPAVLKQFPLQTASYDRGHSYASTFYTNYVAAVGAMRKTVTLGQVVTLDSDADPIRLKIVSVNGTFSNGQVMTSNENDLSVSVLVSFGDFREEIGGDLSGENTSTYQDIETGTSPSIGPIDVYKVHHHCSAYSTNEKWLSTTQPTIAVISDGDNNVYRHPAESCLSRLHDTDIKKVYWTEKGAGAAPGAGDVIAGDIVIKVPSHATTYTVTYSGGSTTETYAIKGHSDVSSTTPTTPAAGSPQPKYAWSSRGHYYYTLNCPAVKRISQQNLRTGDTPPAGFQAAACVTQ